MGKRERAAAFLRRDGAAILLTAGLFWLTYAIVFRFRTGDSDYIDHAVWALGMSPADMLAALRTGKERLWHILVKLIFMRTHNMWSAAALVTAAANAAAYFLVFRFLESAAPPRLPRWLLAALAALAFAVNALTWPGAPFVTDRGYVTTWHNPTNIMVRPFAAAVFFMTLRIYNRRRCGEHAVLVSPEAGGRTFAFEGGFAAQFRRPVYTGAELVLYPMCILLSVYAKPSFLQYFAPAIFIFCVIDVVRTRGMLLPFCLKLALAYLPAALVLASQFFQYFGHFSSAADAEAAARAVGETVSSGGSAYAGTGAAIYYILPSFSGAGEVLRETGRALLLTVYLCAFPFAVFLIDPPRARRSAACRLGLIGVLAARLEALLLHELGERDIHGNFRWAYYVSAWLLWTVALERYAEGLFDGGWTGKLMRFAATPLLLWHLAAGAVNIVRILQTGLYWY